MGLVWVAVRSDFGVIMMFARKEIAKVVGTAMAVAALGLTTPGSAAADATDDAFSRKLFADAVDFAGQNDAVKRARAVCEAFGAGMSPAEVHLTVLNGSAFAPRQAAVFMADAVQFYCPGYAGLFIKS
ncbi:MAG: DUF732 domain-containing protein [Mycobacterium sp.]|uniref:DUF732 domain-containing protein n=1 Tax=Mycobacterium sp. TaxID=1785 RepID=UPI003899DFC9